MKENRLTSVCRLYSVWELTMFRAVFAVASSG